MTGRTITMLVMFEGVQITRSASLKPGQVSSASVLPKGRVLFNGNLL